MAKEISILVSARDMVSSGLSKISGSLKSFNKDAEATARTFDNMAKKQDFMKNSLVKLQSEQVGLSKSLKEAKKAYQGFDDVIGRIKLEGLQKQYNDVSAGVREYTEAIRKNSAAQLAMEQAESRRGNRAGTGGAAGLLSGMYKAGLINLLGGAASEVGGTAATSMFGVPMGGMVNTFASGIVSGAAMGSLIPGPPGAGIAIGAGIGALAGGVQAISQWGAAEDEAFRGVVKEMTQAQLTRQKEDSATGSGIAAGRETTRIAFNTLFGDDAVAGDYLGNMGRMASETPFEYDDLAQFSKILKVYGYTADEILPQLAVIGDAGAALGLDAAGMENVATGLGRMRSSGKTSLEYVNLLQERGIDAIGYLAQDKGVSDGEIYAMISKNMIDGVEASNIISAGMTKSYAGNMEKQASSFAGRQSTWFDAENEMRAAQGEGFNEVRKAGMKDQTDYLSGENGEKMKEANRLIGEWEASLVNDRERMIREAEENVMKSEGFLAARNAGDGAKAGELLAAARIEGEAKFNASEGAQQKLEMEKSLIRQTRDQLVKDRDYWEAGYELGIEYSRGMMAAIRESQPTVFSSYLDLQTNGALTGKSGAAASTPNTPGANSYLNSLSGHAAGLAYVPRDNYFARLHEGERVLTAAEARGYRAGGPTVTVNGGFTVREEADVYKIAQALAEELRRAQMVS